MSKKSKNAESIVRNALTSAFFQYHLNKMSLTEFIIRFLRIDLVSKGKNEEKEELLKIIRNYQRGIKEECECPIVKPEQLSFRQFLKQRKKNERVK